MYRPGCLEHYVLNQLRSDEAFVSELNLVMEKDGRLIGQNMFVKSFIRTDDGRDTPFSPWVLYALQMSSSGRGTAKAVVPTPPNSVFVIRVYPRAKIPHFPLQRAQKGLP